MKPDLLHLLRCPRCEASPLRVFPEWTGDQELLEGNLVCARCGASYVIRRGVPEMVEATDAAADAEVQARVDRPIPIEWHETARMVGDYVDRWVLRGDVGGDRLAGLPEEERGMEYAVADVAGALTRIDVAGKRVLDLGAGTCWTTRVLAKSGATCVAVDITPSMLLMAEAHLGTSPYFHRLAANMNCLPLRDAQFDIVFACGSLHHSSRLTAAFAEIRRVLAPTGALVIAAEPIAGRFRDYTDFLSEHRAQGLNEHMYSLDEFRAAWSAAGFRGRIYFPPSFALQLRGDLPHPPSLKLRIARLLPRAMLPWLLAVGQRAVGLPLQAVLSAR